MKILKRDLDLKPIIIAEVGQNHQGDIKLAKKYVNIFSKAGADIIKFQSRHNRNLFDMQAYNQIYNSENSFGKTYGQHRETLELKKNEPQYYTEGTNEIHSIDIPALQKLVTKIQGENPEFKQYDLIGEIHTHPIIPNKLSQNQHPCDPSDGDVGSISDHYERNVLKPDEPFIFGIAGRGENGQTEYAFYRLIKKDGRYEVRSLN